MAEFRVLGPVEAELEGRSVPLPAAKPRALLAILLLHRNRVVSTGDLIDDLWGEQPPETAGKALQGYVSQLRKALGADRVLTKAPGYSLRIEDGELDLDRFEQLVREGRERLAVGEPKAAAQRLEEALALWRGAPFAEFPAEPFARDAGARLEDARIAAIEERFDADLALGRHARLVPELEELVAREPFRERLRAQLMLALYRSGRQAEALEVYRRTRETLIDELGIEPGEELQELEQAILRHDPSVERPRRPPPQFEPTATATATAPRSRPRALVLLASALALGAIAAGATAFALTRGSSGAGSSRDRPAAVYAVAVKLENFLAQSQEGRQAVAAAVGGAFDCTLEPRAAVARLNQVQRNRQSLLQQVAALTVPDNKAAIRASDLFQQAIHASITADWHYRDWLATRARCGPPGRAPELRAARTADRRATRVKKRFLVAFNPMARRFGLRPWSAAEF